MKTEERMTQSLEMEQPEGTAEKAVVLRDMFEENDDPISFWKDERGIGVVEMILILVVLIALVLIFMDTPTPLIPFLRISSILLL